MPDRLPPAIPDDEVVLALLRQLPPYEQGLIRAIIVVFAKNHGVVATKGGA